MLVAALRDLQWRRRRFIITILGTSLVFAMTLVLAGLSAFFVNEVDRTLATTGADAWAVGAGATGPFNSSAVVPATALTAARALPGVVEASPFVALGGTVGASGSEHVTIIGTVPGGAGHPHVDEGRAPRHGGEVAVGDGLGSGIGSRVEIGGRTFRVVGTLRSSLYGGMPNVFVTLHDMQQLTFGGEPFFTAIAIRGTPRGHVDGVDILSVGDVKTDVLRALGAGRQTITFVAGVLWIVAACIVGSVIYLSTLERVRDFAVFKATGTSTGSLLAGLVFQAVIVSLVAAALAAILSIALGPAFPMPAEVPTSAFLLLPVVAVGVGCVSSLAGLRRAVTVSPAVAFGGA